MKMCRANQVAIVSILAATVFSVGCSGAVEDKSQKPVEIEISTEEEAELEEGILEETIAKTEVDQAPIVVIPKERIENVSKVFPKEIMEALKGLTPEERMEKLQAFIDSGDYDDATIKLIERMKQADGVGQKPIKERNTEETTDSEQ